MLYRGIYTAFASRFDCFELFGVFSGVNWSNLMFFKTEYIRADRRWFGGFLVFIFYKI